MRRRTALPVTATTALLAAALLLPATAAAADPAPTTGATPGTSAPTTDPTVQITGLQAQQTNHGYVLRAAVSGEVDHVVFTLHQSIPTGGPGPRISLTVSQPSPDGTWQTTGPLGVPHGFYWLSAYAYSADGTPSYEEILGGNALPLTPIPVFHNTVFSTGPLSYDAPAETVTGKLTTYDPDTGDTGVPWTGPLTVQASAGNTQASGNVATTKTIAADGSWSISFQPQPNGNGDLPVSVQAALPGLPCPECLQEIITGPSTSVPTALNWPTRIVLDHTSATATAGTKTTVSGVMEYQDTTGWHPLPHTWLFLGSHDTHSSVAQAQTDAAGRFTFTATVPDTTTSWAINPISSIAPYLTLNSADYTITAVADQPSLQLSGASIDANSNLTFHQTVTSATGTPNGTVQLQQSADGHTGWTTITTLPATTATHTVRVSNPHGYWRLYTPTTPGYTQAVSDTVHTFRYQSRITGGPTNTSVRPGTWVHFTGTLTQQGYGPWAPCAGQSVQLWFRPAGSTRTYLEGTAHTNTQGAFALWVRPTTSGTWTLTYQTTSPWNTNASTSTTVHVS
ncbi:hypothetical protein [Streptacidiphilus fuscans]|uniref:Uncharacterized protein n=1 Tax=Streptacidiphilus fuscans TaxID=2789292 RepID=A0A931B558_9ACTN|nr:hypothetical protein [Streptacidiphilus fuscans]MBF9070468.1 hypothetical protein [Streptacidiphilus fuscans]